MNSIDENYNYAVLLPAVLTFHSFTPQSLSIKPKREVTMNFNSTTSRIFAIVLPALIFTLTNFMTFEF
jgi:hypothetical protein